MTWWEEQGYLAAKELDGGLWLAVAEQFFTWRLMVCDEDSVHEFWCYPKEEFSPAEAIAFMEAFDGEGDPHDGWVRHLPSHRRPRSTCPKCDTYGHSVETCPELVAS